MGSVFQCVAMSFVIHQPSDEMCRKCRKDIASTSRGKRQHMVCKNSNGNNKAFPFITATKVVVTLHGLCAVFLNALQWLFNLLPSDEMYRKGGKALRQRDNVFCQRIRQKRMLCQRQRFSRIFRADSLCCQLIYIHINAEGVTLSTKNFKKLPLQSKSATATQI